jgi:hypothetical protein
MIGYPQSISVVVHNNNLLGFSHRAKNYVLGMPERRHAKLLQKYISRYSIDNTLLLRHYVDDVTDIINNGLRNVGRGDIKVDDVTIDVCATIVIPKTEKDKILSTDLQSVLFADFLMYPFSKQIGIALPYEVMEDSETKLVFQAQVVDPAFDVELFRKNLLK